MDAQEALGLGGTDATLDEDDLPPKLVEAIKRNGELSKDVIVVDKRDKIV